MTRVSPPKVVKIGPFPFDVVYRHDSNLAGELEADEGRINLAQDQPLAQEQDSLLHEVLHGCLFVTGVGHTLDDATEERIVRPLATCLLDTLKRNPRLVDYLRSV